MSTTHLSPASEDSTETRAELYRTRCREGRACGSCQECAPLPGWCTACGEVVCVCMGVN